MTLRPACIIFVLPMIETLLIALALAMDCFTISVVSGVIVRRTRWPLILRLALLFGFFQGAMPVLGWLLTRSFSAYIHAFDHWIAFGMLAFIGGKMIVDSFREEGAAPSINPESVRTEFALAVATSIDAMAVGITYACTGYDTLGSLVLPVVVIGAVSFGMSIVGFLLGRRCGDAVTRKMRPELLGGIILLAIGVRILIEHLS